MTIALITGVNGQDGSYLAELLLQKNFLVYGIARHVSHSGACSKLQNIISHSNFHILEGDISDLSFLLHVVKQLEQFNSEIYVFHLAAQSFVTQSFYSPIYTANINAIGTLNIIEAFRNSNLKSKVKIYNAASSEMFGKVVETPQKETTPFYPRSPYGVSKVYAYWICKNYRESYDMFISNGILFNHESPRRGDMFVTRKITKSIARIKNTSDKSPVILGNLDAKRDWGHSKDYVEAMLKILEYNTPDDWVVSTQEMHSVREFVEIAFSHAGISIIWKGIGVDEIGVDSSTGEVLVRVSAEFYRPAEVDSLLGDSTKARSLLNWTPQYSFMSLVHDMVDSDLSINVIE
jgi:GDPmannose 4,6-dehydratase